VSPELARRLPPGQYVETGFPVLSAGPTPRITPEKWRVRQFNPAKDFDLDRGQWQKAQLIVGKFAR